MLLHDIGKPYVKFIREDGIEKDITVEQVLFISTMENFEKVKDKESNTAFINFSVEAYDKYINKPRIYDAMNRFNLTIEFQNYEKY